MNEYMTPEEQETINQAHAYLSAKSASDPLHQAMSIIYTSLKFQLQEATAENQRLKAQLWDVERNQASIKGAL
jgi:hypothetical protein